MLLKIQMSTMNNTGRPEIMIYNEGRSVEVDTVSCPDLWSHELVAQVAVGCDVWPEEFTATGPIWPVGAWKLYCRGCIDADGILRLDFQSLVPECHWPGW